MCLYASIEPPRGQDEQQDGEAVEHHLALSRELIADVREDVLVRPLCIVTDVVAGCGDQPDETEERTKHACDHPHGECAVPPPYVQRCTECDGNNRHSEVFNRPAAEDTEQEHRENRPCAPSTCSCRCVFQREVVRQEKEKGGHCRPEVDRRAALPDSNLTEVRQGEPEEEC